MSYRADFQYSTERRKDQPALSIHGTVSQDSVAATHAKERTILNRDRSSIASSSSGGYRSADSSDGLASDATRARRRSGLPRAVYGQSGAKLDAIVASRHLPGLISENTAFLGNKGQSHQSRATRMQNDSISTREETSTQRLLGKPSRVDSGKGMRSAPRASLDWGLESSIGVAMSEGQKPARPAIMPPPRNTLDTFNELPPRLIPELQALAASQTRANSAHAPSISSMSSASTLFTNSPGTWSSRNTTPTSISSYSPGIVSPLKPTANGKRANTVPVPTVPKTRQPKLPVLQESLHSSSSSMLGREPGVSDRLPASKKKKKRIPLQESPAPTPPPRTSSFKSKKPYIIEKAATGDRAAALDHSVQAVPWEEEARLVNRASTIKETGVDATSLPHSKHMLQHIKSAIPKQPPTRPSRQDVLSLDPRRPTVTEPTWPPSVNNGSNARSKPVAQSPSQRPSRLPLQDQEKHTRAQQRLTEPARPAQPPAANPRPSTSGTQHGASSSAISTPAKQSTGSRLAKWSKLSLFGRSGKSDETTADLPRKLQRRGPAAGTGHEGYGRFARRGRKSSDDSSQAGSSTDRSESSAERLMSRFHSRKQSSGSKRDRNSQSDLDDFAAERMRPVAMLGGSAKAQATNHTVWPNVSAEADPAQIGTALTAPYGRQEYDNSWTTSMSSTTSVLASTSPDRRDPVYPCNQERVPVLHGDDIFGPAYLTSAITSQSSVVSSIPTFATAKHNDKYDYKLEEKPRKLRWNIFSRIGDKSRAPKPQPLAQSQPAPSLAVRLSTIPKPRAVPYYAVMESESENNTQDSFGEVMSHAAESPPPLPISDQALLSSSTFQRGANTLLPPLALPDPAAMIATAPSVALKPVYLLGSKVGDSLEQPRRRRLAAVGRIPRVASRKGRGAVDDDPVMSKSTTPTPVNPQPPSHTRPVLPGLKTDVSAFTSHQAMKRREVKDRDEFLQFPSKHNSDVSESSSSTGLYSLIPPMASVPASTNVRASRSHVGEDEVWKEYDDFLDHVMSPTTQRENELYKMPSSVQDGSHMNPMKPASTPREEARAPKSKHVVPSQDVPIVLRSHLGPSAPSSIEDTRLRRSRIVSALHSSVNLNSPFSIGDYFSEHEDWRRDSHTRLSNSSADKSGQLVPAPVLPQAAFERSRKVEPTQQHNAVLLDAVGRAKNPVAQSELHFSSLMISRWLSFGRVLFSPAHEEINALPQRHVLVLDGLGSADWSIFCSVTYAATNTFVHDLKEKGSQPPIEPDHTPPNYRRAEVRSWSERFPFPPSFFSAIVLRFPPAMADRQLRNIIAECKRLLAPGGFLELMLMDLDIVNMGLHTRRAVRDLKIRITSADRATSLKPLSDNIQSHLGQQGFPSLSRCVVGVPVAGQPSGSLDSSSSSRSSGGSYVQQQLSPDASKRGSHRQHGHNFSLSDLVADHSDNADAKIGKMVSKTARNWWQHCFEAAVIADGDLARSIFSDKLLMRECKTRGSNFKMLLAYTQKPTEHKRRTMSEPNVPTLATAGLRRGKKTM